MIVFSRYSWEYEIDNKHYRPVEDSIPVRTWRQQSEEDIALLRTKHKYPLRGCHGDKLDTSSFVNRTDIP